MTTQNDQELTTCDLYRHGTELVTTVEIPFVFPNLPDVIKLNDSFYRNVSLYERPFHATYFLASCFVVEK